MCGINGLYTRSQLTNPSSQLLGMNQAIQHRGPDSTGLWVHPSAQLALGHQRLSIVDLSTAGNQPMHDTQSRNVIIFNGEIFNHHKLRAEYLDKELFVSQTDTEVILKLYAKLGVNSFALLDGMFAFAIWDAEQEKLILARDFSGKKPLYYTASGGLFSFSSEIKALFTLPHVTKNLDTESLYHFLTFSSLPEPYTMFSNIHKFMPGHYMELHKGRQVTYQPFKVLSPENLDNHNEAQLISRTQTEIETTIHDRLMSDVPLGAFLSGGVDSSLVVALMRKYTNQTINTFTVSFADQPAYDELKYAEQISKMFNTNHYVKNVTRNEIVEMLPRIVDIFDEPLSDTTTIPLYFISELAQQQHTKVVLTGDGVDELFAGYRSFLKYDKHYPTYNALKRVPKPVLKLLSNIAEPFNNNAPIFDILHRASKGQELAWIGANGFKESTKHKLLSPNFKQKVAAFDSCSIVQQYRTQFTKHYASTDHVAWMCYMGYHMASINRYLFRSDRLAMAHSVETRSPFLSSSFVNFAMSVPSAYKIKNAEPKYLFKKAAEAYLPHHILYRKKQGFNVPIREWINGDIIKYIETNFANFAQQTDWFDTTEVHRQVKQLKSGNYQYVNNVWTIYFLMNWYKRWFS